MKPLLEKCPTYVFETPEVGPAEVHILAERGVSTETHIFLRRGEAPVIYMEPADENSADGFVYLYDR